MLFMLFGLDIASYQGTPDFAEVARKHDFMITKVTGEGSYVNPYWRQNMDAATVAGLIVGGYDWVEPQSELSGREAAIDYLLTLGAIAPGELLCVDFETPDWARGHRGTDIEQFMVDYLYALKELTGQRVIVYTANYFLQETGASGWAWLGRDFLLWLAAPGPAAMLDDGSFWPAAPAPWSVATIHQHQWHALGGGVQGEYDRNRFQGTREELLALGAPGAGEPGEQTGGGEVQEPAAFASKAYTNERGETIVVSNYGGEAVEVLGVVTVDQGVAVKNAGGETWDQSQQAGVFLGWRLRDTQVAPEQPAEE